MNVKDEYKKNQEKLNQLYKRSYDNLSSEEREKIRNEITRLEDDNNIIQKYFSEFLNEGVSLFLEIPGLTQDILEKKFKNQALYIYGNEYDFFDIKLIDFYKGEEDYYFLLIYAKDIDYDIDPKIGYRYLNKFYYVVLYNRNKFEFIDELNAQSKKEVNKILYNYPQFKRFAKMQNTKIKESINTFNDHTLVKARTVKDLFQLYEGQKAIKKAMKHSNKLGSGAKKRKKLNKKDKFKTVMKEFERGTLHSGGSGKIVKDKKQALAIAYSEAGMSKKESLMPSIGEFLNE